MADLRPVIYASGRSNATTVVAGISAAATTFDVVAAGAMAAGDAIFCSESDNSEQESLGTISAVDGTTITVTHGPTLAKSANCKIWTATYKAVMPYPITGRPRVEVVDGIERRSTLDGIIHNTQIADVGDFWTINYAQVENSSLAALRTFLAESNGANYGLTDFVVAMWDYESDAPTLATVRLAGEIPSYIEGVRGVSSYSLRVQIITSSEYPA